MAAIARKIGLPEDLIADASEIVGSERMDYDKHLQDIVRDKRYWENKRRDIRLKEKKLEDTLAKYEAEMATIEKFRKEIVLKAKQEAQSLLSNTNATIENTIRIIKEAHAEKEKTKDARKNLEAFKHNLTSGFEPKTSSEALIKCTNNLQLRNKNKNTKPEIKGEKPEIRNLEPLKSGSNVRLKGQAAIGKVLEIHDKSAVVAFGQMKSTVKLSKLEVVSHISHPKEKHKFDAIAQTTNDEVRQRKLTFKSEIDVRGMRVDEAIQAVTYFIDDAIMVGVSTVRILHGTGTGVLRQTIRQYVATIHGVANYHDEHVQFGGAGITIVDLE